MALIAPSKLSPKGDYLYLEAHTTSGTQARTINRPLIWHKSQELLRSIIFAYGIDDRYWDASHVEIKEISIKYQKNVKSSFDTEARANLTLYQDSMFDVAVEAVNLKVYIGSTTEDGEGEHTFGFGVTLTLPWSDFEAILPDLWQGCVKEWDKQLLVEFEAIQLSLIDQLPKISNQKVLGISKQDGPIDIAAYSFPEDELMGRRGLLTGSALEQRKLKLVREGIATPIHDIPSRPFGFDPSA
jgi:hypothetical protein